MLRPFRPTRPGLPSAGQRRAHRLALRPTQGAPCSGLSCSLTDTVTERLPSGDDARNCV